ncbi:MAG: restriction endonuclease subunit S [Paenirhodobacter sp.]|uniref:restriction endonuclease subunit S n=1 Tax=Paenirhodobacter sp. TaxID=1965326 RepID=UPI003D0AEDE0
MKAGWEVRPLGEVCTVVNGGTPKSNIPAYWDGTVNWLTPKDMGQMKGRYISDTPRKITEDGLANSSARLVPPQSVIMSTRAPIGHLAINETPMAFNQGCRGMVPGASLDTTYLFHFLSANIEALNELGTGATFRELSASALKGFAIPLPPLEEQKRIVAILDEAFEGLDRARANAEANLADARELFESYLELEFSIPPDDWRPESLGALCRQITVGHVGPMAERYVETGIPFLRSQNIKPFMVDLSGVKYIDAKFMAELRKSELRPGDVVIVRTGYPGTCAVIPDDLELANCADIVIARPGPNLDPHFMTMLLNSRYGKDHVARVSVGAAQKHFNVAAAKAAIFPIPPISVQRQLVEKSAEIRGMENDLVARIQNKEHLLSTLRQSLLQKAFSGALS